MIGCMGNSRDREASEGTNMPIKGITLCTNHQRLTSHFKDRTSIVPSPSHVNWDGMISRNPTIAVGVFQNIDWVHGAEQRSI